MLLSIAAAVLAMSALTSLTHIAFVGTDRIVLQVLRFVFAAALLAGTYRGIRLAEGILIFALLVGGVLGLITSVSVIQSLNPAVLIVIPMSIVYITAAIILVRSPAVRSFIEWKRAW